MEERICTLTLLCLVFSGVGAVKVVIPNKVYEYARGDNITLPCSYETSITPKLIIITWSVKENEEETTILTYYSNDQTTDVNSKYEGRVSLALDLAKKRADLKLSSISLADNKVFECRFQIPHDDEGTPADTTRLVVLVAPSQPICKVQGRQEYGQNINLTCVSEEGSPPPTYKWDIRDVNNIPRVRDPKTTDKGGILSMYNISKDSSGYYICTSTNKIRSASCNITLKVMPPSVNIGSTAGIIGGVVAGLILLVVIIYCCCCRKKDKEEEYAMGVREEEYHDKGPAKNEESRRADGQEDRQGYDDSSRRSPTERDPRRDYDDRRSEYSDRRSDYDDRRSDYDDRRSDYSDRREKYNDRHERYDDRHHNDRYDEPYDDRDRDRPPVPALKPPRRDYND